MSIREYIDSQDESIRPRLNTVYDTILRVCGRERNSCYTVSSAPEAAWKRQQRTWS